ncbi:MAG: phosphoglycerate kinase [Bacteroidales bacterium]|nr:phosphoglycerate kinase [Bacteroidales bacterium]
MNTIENFDFKGKKVLIRVDFNVPLNDSFEITDDTRMRKAVPTIKKVIDNGGSAILMSHVGRPKGEVQDKFSLKHIVKHLTELLGVEVKMAPDCIGDKVKQVADNLQQGEVLLLENLRFHAAETKGDFDFSKKLSELADVYINDAFGTAHRAHASTTIVADFFPNAKLFGYIMESELKSLDKVMEDVHKPYTAIIGGSKVSSKITIIENLLTKVDNLIIGGGMAFTFVKANGGNIGNSLVEEDFLEKIPALYELAEKNNAKIHLPVDSLNADKFDKDAHVSLSDIDKIPNDRMGLDIGPKTVDLFKKVISQSKTILWNGPVGVFEFEKFEEGTKAVGLSIAEATKNGAFSLIGGGDSVAAISKFDLTDQVSYVSTGGGALLEYMEGKILPGIAAIKK